jgi:hypothetical protein
MKRHMHTRDFTLCKAAALVGLMIVAGALGKIQEPRYVQGEQPAGERIIPALFFSPEAPQQTGTDL